MRRLITGAAGKHKEMGQGRESGAGLGDNWNSNGKKRIIAIMSTSRTPLDALTLQLLMWLSARPRTYGEAMGAWRTSCPRMPIWEDAIDARLIRVEKAGAMRDALVVLTDRGRAALADASTPVEAPVRRVDRRVLNDA